MSYELSSCHSVVVFKTGWLRAVGIIATLLLIGAAIWSVRPRKMAETYREVAQ